MKIEYHSQNFIDSISSMLNTYVAYYVGIIFYGLKIIKIL